MSARELEDFIGLIEKAEKLSTSRTNRSSLVKSPTSSNWSYPTDLFQSRRNPNSGYGKSAGSSVQVPPLWEPSAPSEVLGSSWSSAASIIFDKNDKEASAIRTESSRSKSSSVQSRSTEARKGSISISSVSSPKNSVSVVEKPKTDYRAKQRDSLMMIQKHSKFGRVQARELSPAVSTPSASPATARKQPVVGHGESPTTKKKTKQKSAKKSGKSNESSSDSDSEEDVKCEGGLTEDEIDEILEESRGSSIKSQTSTPARSPTPISSVTGSTVKKNASPKKQKASSKKKEPKKPTEMDTPKKQTKKSDDLNTPKKSDAFNTPKKLSKKSDPSSAQATPKTVPKTPTSVQSEAKEIKHSSGSTTPISTPSKIPRGRPAISRGKSFSSSSQPPTPQSTPSPMVSSRVVEQFEDERDNSPGIPRTPPKPRPRVVIRQDSVMVHVHEQPIQSNLETVAEKTNQKKKRPASAPSITRKKVQTQPDAPPPNIDLRSYSKSLRLLGLDIPSNRKEAVKLAHHQVKVTTNTPSMRTRLSRRTQSVSDLREQVDSKEMMPKSEFVEIRESLGRAVFEAWYFQKIGEEQERKKAKEEATEAEKQKQKEEELEKKSKAEVEYKQWLEEKKSAHRKMIRRKHRKETNKEKEKEEHLAKIRQAEADWKAKKEKEVKRASKLAAKLAKKKEEEEKKKAQKKEESEKQFMKWKEGISEKWKARLAAERQAQLEALEAKKKAANEKKSEAKLAFDAWKIKKEKEKKKKQELAAKGKKKVVEKPVDKETRMREAREAYDAWLEFVEEREEEKRLEEEERKLREMWRPPWYPA